MNVSVTIPQLFYDLIARVIPGFAFLFGLRMELGNLGISVVYSNSSGESNWFGSLSSGLAFFFLAYLTGWLLSGLVLLFKGELIDKRDKPIDKAASKKKYQEIRILHPASGFRIVKLRSEARMLESLCAGLILIALIVPLSFFVTDATVSYMELGIRVFVTLAVAGLFYMLQRRAWKQHDGNVMSIHKLLFAENILSRIPSSH